MCRTLGTIRLGEGRDVDPRDELILDLEHRSAVRPDVDRRAVGSIGDSIRAWHEASYNRTDQCSPGGEKVLKTVP